MKPKHHAPSSKAKSQLAKIDQAQSASPPQPFVSARASKLASLGLRTDMDLVLHLPLRYEDETPIDADCRGGISAQKRRRKWKAW